MKMTISNGKNYRQESDEVVHRTGHWEWVMRSDGTGVKRAIDYPTTVYRNLDSREAVDASIAAHERYDLNHPE